MLLTRLEDARAGVHSGVGADATVGCDLPDRPGAEIGIGRQALFVLFTGVRIIRGGRRGGDNTQPGIDASVGAETAIDGDIADHLGTDFRGERETVLMLLTRLEDARPGVDSGVGADATVERILPDHPGANLGIDREAFLMLLTELRISRGGRGGRGGRCGCGAGVFLAVILAANALAAVDAFTTIDVLAGSRVGISRSQTAEHRVAGVVFADALKDSPTPIRFAAPQLIPGTKAAQLIATDHRLASVVAAHAGVAVVVLTTFDIPASSGVGVPGVEATEARFTHIYLFTDALDDAAAAIWLPTAQLVFGIKATERGAAGQSIDSRGNLAVLRSPADIAGIATDLLAALLIVYAAFSTVRKWQARPLITGPAFRIGAGVQLGATVWDANAFALIAGRTLALAQVLIVEALTLVADRAGTVESLADRGDVDALEGVLVADIADTQVALVVAAAAADRDAAGNPGRVDAAFSSQIAALGISGALTNLIRLWAAFASQRSQRQGDAVDGDRRSVGDEALPVAALLGTGLLGRAARLLLDERTLGEDPGQADEVVGAALPIAALQRIGAAVETAGGIAIGASAVAADVGVATPGTLSFLAADRAAGRQSAGTAVAVTGAEPGGAAAAAAAACGGIGTADAAEAAAGRTTEGRGRAAAELPPRLTDRRGRRGDARPCAYGAGIDLVRGHTAGDSSAPQTEQPFEDRAPGGAGADKPRQTVELVPIHARLPASPRGDEPAISLKLSGH
jgi:hypothetical protein